MIVSASSLDMVGLEKHCDYAAKAGLRVVCTNRREAHSLREANDLCHGANVAPIAASIPTMINGAFQGGA